MVSSQATFSVEPKPERHQRGHNLQFALHHIVLTFQGVKSFPFTFKERKQQHEDKPETDQAANASDSLCTPQRTVQNIKFATYALYVLIGQLSFFSLLLHSFHFIRRNLT